MQIMKLLSLSLISYSSHLKQRL